MLTLRQILLCYEQGVELHFSQMHNPEGAACTFSNCMHKGSYSFADVHIFLPHILSHDDLVLTVVHELIHARDDVIQKFYKARENLTFDEIEDIVEQEAVDTYSDDPGLICFIEEVYNVRLSDLSWKKCKKMIRYMEEKY